MYSDFSCPKCGSYMFGSRKEADGSWTRRCHGNEQWVCKFEFPSTDDHLYFKEEVKPESGIGKGSDDVIS